MATSTETIIPHAKPAFELIDERLSQKVSPQYDHARLQRNTSLFGDGQGRGRVGSSGAFTSTYRSRATVSFRCCVLVV